MLKGACRNACYVVSVLDKLVDRFALCCLSTSPETRYLRALPILHGFNIGLESELFQLLTTFPVIQSWQNSEVLLTAAVKEVMEWLVLHSRKEALCDIILVTGRSALRIHKETSKGSIRLHTLSPTPSFALTPPEPMNGWHLEVPFEDQINREVELRVGKQLEQQFRHFRLGTDPGILSNVKLQLEFGTGCVAESILGELDRATLRPGERWTIPVKIRALCRDIHAEEDPDMSQTGVEMTESSPKALLGFDTVIRQLDHMLNLPDPTTQHRTLFTAILEYNHSALPESSVVRTVKMCNVSGR